MKLGLVKYKGAASAPITIAPGGFGNRLWAKGQSVIGSPVQQNRWLPEAEAVVYDALPDFTVVRYGERGVDKLIGPSQRKRRVPNARTQPKPKPIAKPLAQLVAAVETLLETIPENPLEADEPEEPMFLMSSSGMVHRTSCSIAARTKPVETFWQIDDATAHPRFNRLHKCV